MQSARMSVNIVETTIRTFEVAEESIRSWADDEEDYPWNPIIQYFPFCSGELVSDIWFRKDKASKQCLGAIAVGSKFGTELIALAHRYRSYAPRTLAR